MWEGECPTVVCNMVRCVGSHGSNAFRQFNYSFMSQALRWGPAAQTATINTDRATKHSKTWLPKKSVRSTSFHFLLPET